MASGVEPVENVAWVAPTGVGSQEAKGFCALGAMMLSPGSVVAGCLPRREAVA